DAADKEFIAYIKHAGITLLLTLLLLGAFVQLLSKTIHSQVARALNVLQQIADRNLSMQIQGIGRDEFSQINQALEHTRRNLNQLLFRQRDSATTLSATTTQMNSGMQQVTRAVQDQRERLDSLATSMEEMATTIRDVAHNAHQSADDNQLTDKMAARGVAQIATSIQTIQQLFTNLATSADSVNTVEQRVGEISSVVSTINSISEQTNLLALNAAIEAARAGDQGRGFAVVADEVRQLAKRTQQATHEIDLMITSLQQGTRQAVNLMNTSVEHAQLAMDDASAANQEFVAIAQQTSLQAQRGEMIASAAEEQSIVATQVTDTLVVIRDAVEVTEHVVKELEQASNNLRDEAHALASIVSSYQLAQ
ncbi:MAG: methyl-accepting chemotaxis protein, partial [Aeromonadaceae bacterium]